VPPPKKKKKKKKEVVLHENAEIGVTITDIAWAF